MMKDKERNIGVVNLGEAKDTQQIRAAIDAAQRNFDARRPIYSLLARERFTQYEEYKKAGFADHEAMRLLVAEIMRPNSAT